MSIWIGLAASLMLLLVSALHMGLRIPGRSRIARYFEQHGLETKLEQFVLHRPQFVLATSVVRSAMVLVLLLCAMRIAGALGPNGTMWRLAIACGSAWSVHLIIGVAIPFAWAKYAGDALVARGLPALRLLRSICYPLIMLMNLFDPLIRRLTGVPIRDAKFYADEFEQEIRNALSEGERYGAVDEEEKEMIESVIELADTQADGIMTPRTDIVALPLSADLDTVLESIRTNGYSRIPVYDETIDSIVGVVYAKDLLRRDTAQAFDLSALKRPPLFIPETKYIRELLRDFQAKKVHIAIVLDEYGGTAGLVTIEDILEELVGEIVDEYETHAPDEIKRLDDHAVEVDARARVDELNDELGLAIPEEEDYETIGGFVFSTLGKMPVVGDKCEYDNVKIKVLEADTRRILRLHLEITAPKEPDEASLS